MRSYNNYKNYSLIFICENKQSKEMNKEGIPNEMTCVFYDLGQ